MAKRGRPKLDVAKREVLQVRVLPEIKAEFKQAARLCKPVHNEVGYIQKNPQAVR